MASPLTLAGRLTLDPSSWNNGLGNAQQKTRTFASGVRREMGALGGFLTSTAGKLATYGASFAVGAQLVKSAGLDKTLTQIGQTAGASRDQVKALRGEIFGMASTTGRATDDLTQGFNILVQSGLQWNESRETLGAINKTMAVTGAQAETLAGSLGVASTAFRFDLSKPKLALDLLDKMTVAGRLGNAELENLGSIFSRVGVNAKGAGFGFDQTLAFIEGLSMIERQPERLATLADSTMRLFTNARYMAAAQKASGVRFFDKASGERRDPLQILADLKKRMDAMKTDAQREGFLSKAFGNADQDTIKGLRTLLSGDSLAKINQFSAQIGNAGGTIERDLPAAIANAVDQTGRLKARLKDAADAFAQPINAVYSKLVSKALGNGGKDSGLSNAGLIGGGVGVLAGGYLIKRLLGGLAGRLLGSAGSLAGGVAMGAALDKAGAATPVFVVGAAPGVFSGGGAGSGVLDVATGAVLARTAARKAGTAAVLSTAAGTLSLRGLLGMGAAGVGTAAAGVGAAGAAGYGIGTGLYNLSERTASGRKQNEDIGRGIAKLLAFFGNDNARETLALDARARNRPADRSPLFANVRGRADTMPAATAPAIGAAVASAIATDNARRPMKLDLDVHVTDTRTTVTARGKDFGNVRSTSNTRPGNTGRIMGDRS